MTDVIDIAYDTALLACRRATEVVMPLWPNPSNRSFDASIALETFVKAGTGNYATVADLRAEQRIVEVVQAEPMLATHTIMSEESEPIVGDDEWRWIVDPIDGTQNFMNGIPDFGICIALLRGNEPVVGVIAMPALQQMVAVKYGDVPRLLSYDGAELADLRQLTNAYANSLNETIVGYNLGYNDRAQQLEVIATKLVDNVGYAACLGSFATGNFRLVQRMMGAYFGMAPTVMDIAPAAILIPSIGGVVTDLAGQPIDWNAHERTYVGALTPRLHEQFLTTFNA